jgi:predicted molibdopterin-dependent oxidoreductase YjgC
MTRLARSKTILVVADDLESSHNVAALRVKDAVVRNKARLIVVSPFWGELNDFADVVVQPAAGDVASTVAALASAVEEATGAAKGERPAVPESLIEPLAKAVELLVGALKEEPQQPLSVVCGLPHYGAEHVRTTTAALANIAVACAGDEAPHALFVLPQEANVWGTLDTGVSADLLPTYRPAGDEAARKGMERLWGVQLPSAAGLTLEQMTADGAVKALVVMNDNPLMLVPGRVRVRKMLEGLEFLAVIDSLSTDTAGLAHVVLPDAPAWGKEGTTTSADRRVLALNQALAPHGESRQGWRILTELGKRLAERFQPGEIRINYADCSEIMDEMAQVNPLYANARYGEMDSGAQQHIDGLGPKRAIRQAVPAPAEAKRNGGFTLSTGRTLYLSYEGAAIHAEDADKLHREDCARINPADAKALGVSEGDSVVLRNAGGEVRVRADITAAVQPRTVFLPLYYDGGAVSQLFESDSAVTAVEVSRA